MLRIALVQQAVGPAPARNLTRGLEAARRAAGNGARLVAFPELAFTEFHPQNRLGGDRLALTEPVPGPTTDAFQKLAQELGIVVVLNLFERDGDRAFDSSPVIDANGSLLGVTRMMHITQYEGFWEQDYYDPGDTGAPVYQTAVGRIGVAICYDRHFPEYMRALAVSGAQLVVVPQAGAVGEWPGDMFTAELRTAAFQNGYFAALVNRVGRESVLEFAGGSFVTDAEGTIVDQAPTGEEATLITDIDLGALQTATANALFKRHRRPDDYENGAARTRLVRPADQSPEIADRYSSNV
ncbi:MAG: carbon-nitrogen hydrolase family protein [Rhodothermales bacterium]|nr:carbon-nitrogen hydrolase family protein [Rhodothermales bacterium]